MTFSQFITRLGTYLTLISRFLGASLKNVFNFAAVVTAVGLFIFGGLIIYQVQLRDEIVPDVTGPVSRFIANIDFENRTVDLDATISKSKDADLEIAIWRLGDGTVIKTEDSEITEKQTFSYTFEKPGTYQLSYSVIDSNDLSDEAFCTITFNEEDTNNDSGKTVNTGYLDYNGGTDCGKSYASYNQSGGIYAINESRSEQREALMYIGGAVSVLIATLVVNTALFIAKKRD